MRYFKCLQAISPGYHLMLTFCTCSGVVVQQEYADMKVNAKVIYSLNLLICWKHLRNEYPEKPS